MLTSTQRILDGEVLRTESSSSEMRVTKPPLERLDSYVIGLVGFGVVGLFFGVAIITLLSGQIEQGGWILVGWILALGSAMALLTGMIGHAIRLAAKGIIEASGGVYGDDSTAPLDRAAESPSSPSTAGL